MDSNNNTDVVTMDSTQGVEQAQNQVQTQEQVQQQQERVVQARESSDHELIELMNGFAHIRIMRDKYTIITFKYDKKPAQNEGKFPGGVYYSINHKCKHYYLFPTKNDYICNFLDYYLSINAIRFDKYSHKLVALFKGIPLLFMKDYPKLAQVKTTISEVRRAIETLSDTCIMDVNSEYDIATVMPKNEQCAAMLNRFVGFPDDPEIQIKLSNSHFKNVVCDFLANGEERVAEVEPEVISDDVVSQVIEEYNNHMMRQNSSQYVPINTQNFFLPPPVSVPMSNPTVPAAAVYHPNATAAAIYNYGAFYGQHQPLLMNNALARHQQGVPTQYNMPPPQPHAPSVQHPQQYMPFPVNNQLFFYAVPHNMFTNNTYPAMQQQQANNYYSAAMNNGNIGPNGYFHNSNSGIVGANNNGNGNQLNNNNNGNGTVGPGIVSDSQ